MLPLGGVSFNKKMVKIDFTSHFHIKLTAINGLTSNLQYP